MAARWILQTLGLVAFLAVVMVSAAFALGLLNEVVAALFRTCGG